MIRILTDSTADIPRGEAAAIGVDVVPLRVSFGTSTYRDGIDLTSEEFYQKLAVSKNLPTTSQPSPEDFLPYFEHVKEQRDELIALLISSKLSGTVQSAEIAKRMIGYDAITIIDSANTIAGLRLLVEQAVALRDEGKSSDEIVDFIESIKHKVKIFAVADTLEYFYKGGRLSKTSAIAGSILNFKPQISLSGGEVAVLGKSRGTKKAINDILDCVDPASIDKRAPVYFGYSSVSDLCDELVAEAQKRFSLPDIRLSPVGGVIGTHAGPNACVIVYLEK